MSGYQLGDIWTCYYMIALMTNHEFSRRRFFILNSNHNLNSSFRDAAASQESSFTQALIIIFNDTILAKLDTGDCVPEILCGRSLSLLRWNAY